MTMIAKGRLRHRFWGDYSAAIGFWGCSGPQIQAHLERLGIRTSEIERVREDGVLVVLDSDRTEWFAKLLEEDHGLPRIDSLATSIDYGPPFEIEIPYTDLVTPPLPFPNPWTAWNVYLDNRLITTVFCDDDLDADYVKRSLIDHDGFDPRITIRKAS